MSTRMPALIVLLALGLGAVGASPAVGLDRPRAIQVTVGSECIEGTGPARTPVTVVVRTPGGLERGMVSAPIGPKGRFFGCFGTGLEHVNAGDRIEARMGGWRRSWIVPTVRLRIDRTADRVWGTGPAGTTIPLSVRRPERGVIARVSGVAGADGRFDRSLARTVDLIAGDTVAAVLRRGALRVTTQAAVPWIRVTAATDLLVVVGQPDAGASVRLIRNGTTRASGRSTDLGDGLNVVPLRTATGAVAYPRAGDRVVTDVVGLPRLLVPRSALGGDPARDRVRGRCMPGARFGVTVQSATGFRFAFVAGRTGPDGRFERVVGRQLDLRRGDLLDLACAWPGGDLFTVSSVVR